MIKNCKLKFRTVSQFQISGKSSSRNISPIFFKVVPCRPFVFIIKVTADQGTYVYVDNKNLRILRCGVLFVLIILFLFNVKIILSIVNNVVRLYYVYTRPVTVLYPIFVK